ncbi:hypothetical protein ACFMOM_04950 [Schaalia turicensis]
MAIVGRRTGKKLPAIIGLLARERGGWHSHPPRVVVVVVPM